MVIWIVLLYETYISNINLTLSYIIKLSFKFFDIFVETGGRYYIDETTNSEKGRYSYNQTKIGEVDREKDMCVFSTMSNSKTPILKLSETTYRKDRKLLIK